METGMTEHAVAFHKALPSTMIDLIRDGVLPADLKAQGSGSLSQALIRTAMSARQCGWTYAEWAGEVLMRRSKLGSQLSVKKGREVPRGTVNKALLKAWDKAGQRIEESPAP